MVAVPDPLRGLFPGGGIRPGSLVAVTGSTSLLLALLSTASADGAWCGAVGFSSLGALAAAELGIGLERFAVIDDPGSQWTTVTAALFDGMDLVALRPPARARPVDLRTLARRARSRAVALLVAGNAEGADVRLHAERTRWEGLGAGHGRLRRGSVEVRSTGRGSASRPRTASLPVGPAPTTSPTTVHFGRAS